MKNSQKYLIAALATASPFLIASRYSATKIAFAPSEGSSVTKTFTNIMEFSMDDMSMLMNGEENPMMPEMEMDMQAENVIEITDTYESLGRGKPKKLSRTFDTIGMEMDIALAIEAMGQVEEQNPTGSGSSELEGETVIIQWDEDDEEYKFSYPEDAGGDEDLLENLVEDMDLRFLLPEDEVSEGDTWDLPLVSLVDLLAPGGDLKLEMEMDGQDVSSGPPPEMMTNFREMFGDILDGEATATFVGTRDADGDRVAVLELSIEIDTATDMAEFLEEMMGEEIPEGMEFSMDRVDVEFALEATGTCLWNIGAGHIHSLEMEGEAAMAMDMEMGMDFGGQSMSMEMSMEMSGVLTTTVATE